MEPGLLSLPYTLEDACPIAWQPIAEEALHANYPLFNQEDTNENFVIRRYLETLWLPESFNPLSHLITSLKRVSSSTTKSGRDNVHLLHTLLEPLLLSTRAATDKYHTELVQILENGEGGGGPEEAMMWYAWEHEKTETDGMDESTWRKQWLERLEHREAMIQILISMLKITLPGPNPSTRGRSLKKKKKKEPAVESDEERLENYMDRLAVWQLTSSLDNGLTSSQGSSQGKGKSERHWTQVFCEDVVEKLFKAELPDQCDLLRSKVFPTSPFSDVDESDDEQDATEKRSRAGSRAPSLPRKAALQREASVTSQTELQRHRSRSLSVSLANDEASKRANVVESKRTLSREISMSLAFKEKAKPRRKAKTTESAHQSKPSTVAKKEKDVGITLIAETPAKRKHSEMMVDNQGARALDQSYHYRMASSVPSPPPTSSSPGDIVIEDTPIIARTRQKQNGGSGDVLAPPSPLSPVDEQDETSDPPPNKLKALGKASGMCSKSGSRAKGSGLDANIADWPDENADESFNESFGSPDVLLLGSDGDVMVTSSPLVTAKARKPFGLKPLSFKMSMRLDTGGDVEMETPTKKRTRRK